MFGDVLNVSVTVVCGQPRSEAAGPSMGKAMPRACRNPLQRRLSLMLPTFAFGAASRRISPRKHSSFRTEHTPFSGCFSHMGVWASVLSTGYFVRVIMVRQGDFNYREKVQKGTTSLKNFIFSRNIFSHR